ncbi:TonB C-terminal domain-containing protein [Massilia sp. PWRC2]|uniref:TonB C-terminal domain-containing protein n=1 Tax=Massilia sp. PWRC2 TaxID=2804626 RepID=UPI003CF58967
MHSQTLPATAVRRHRRSERPALRLLLGVVLSALLHAALLLLRFGPAAQGGVAALPPLRVVLAPQMPALDLPLSPASASTSAAAAAPASGMRLVPLRPAPLALPAKSRGGSKRRVPAPSRTAVISQERVVNDFVLPQPGSGNSSDAAESQDVSDAAAARQDGALQAEKNEQAQQREAEQLARLAQQQLADEQAAREQQQEQQHLEAKVAAQAIAQAQQDALAQQRQRDEQERLAQQSERLRQQDQIDEQRRREDARRQAEELQRAQERSQLELRREQQARIEQARIEQARIEQARIEQARSEQARSEQQLNEARLNQQRLDQERLSQQRLLEQQRIEQERIEQERIADQRRQIEAQRLAEQRRQIEQQERQRQQMAQQQIAQQQSAQEQRAQEQRAQEQRAQEQRAQEQARARQQSEQAGRDQAERDAATQRMAAPVRNPTGAGAAAGAGAGGGGGGGNGAATGSGRPSLGSAAAERVRELTRGIDLLSGVPPGGATARADNDGKRRVTVGTGERDVVLRMYVDSIRLKIERNGGIAFAAQDADRVRIEPLVSMTVRSDGSVDEVTIVRSSGQPKVDQAVRRIIAVNARYSAFPPNVAARYDVIEIRRIWSFTDTLRLLEELR